MKWIRFLALLVVLCAGLAAESSAQSGPCLSQPDSVELFLEVTKHVFEYSDSAAMASIGIPWTAQNNVQPVSDTVACASAVAAFNAATGTTGTGNADVAGYVFSLGGAGYAYVRPGDGTAHGTHPVYFFSTGWVFKGTIMS